MWFGIHWLLRNRPFTGLIEERCPPGPQSSRLREVNDGKTITTKKVNKGSCLRANEESEFKPVRDIQDT